MKGLKRSRLNSASDDFLANKCVKGGESGAKRCPLLTAWIAHGLFFDPAVYSVLQLYR